MKTTTTIAVLVTIAIWTSLIRPSDGAGPVTIVSAVFNIVNVALNAWKFFNNRTPTMSDLSTELFKIESELDSLAVGVGNVDSEMYGLVSRLSKNTRTELKLHEVTELISKVNAASKLFNEYMKYTDETETSTFEDFATWCISHNPNSISNILERIHTIITPVSQRGLINPGVLSLILESMKQSNEYMCDMEQSPNQLLYNMYSTILLTEIKGYTMKQFSWMILKLFGKGNFTIESKIATRVFQERINVTLEACKNVLRQSNTALWRCDPQRHKLDETYTELVQLLQGYIENEVDLNGDETCKENCAYYQSGKNHGCFKEQFCAKQPICHGKVVKCTFVESDMKICQSSTTSNRRYEWIEYESGKMYGKRGKCQKGVTTVDSWWRWLFWHCSYCMCLCDHAGPKSDRYFSLKEEIANTKMNKVIVGIRFVKMKKVIYVQISEGTLLPGGKIDQKSVTWRKIDPMDTKYAQKDKDYHEMSYEKRSIDLHDLKGPKEHVMTGVRFKMLGSHLNFEVQMMPFNFETGELYTDKYVWISNDNTPITLNREREILHLNEPDIPTNYKSSLPDSKDNQYLEFTHTDFVKDAAQTTVPFIDVQPVISKIPIPLSGAGVYHKGSPGSGGFVALKVYTYDYTDHLNAVFQSIENDQKLQYKEGDIVEVETVTREEEYKNNPFELIEKAN